MGSSFRKGIKKLVKLVRVILILIRWMFTSFNGNKNVAFVFNISPWKYSTVKLFLTEYDVQVVPSLKLLKLFSRKISKINKKVIITWGYIDKQNIYSFANFRDIPVYHLEDGFIRSKGLGSFHSLPYSLCLDKKGMYFDSRRPSDLENILNNYNFKADPMLLARAKHGIQLIRDLGLSKYNHINKKNPQEIYGPKKRKRILVIGQVEDDASILYGSDKKWTNNDLVRLASFENPDAEVLYKPHPDVLTGKRKEQSNPDDVRHLAKIIEEPLGLVDSLKTIDHVYTITSLSGFEALLHGISVTTVGAPFYSGWGVTDDRQIINRRKRTLSIEEIFAAAYILYPKYRDPYTKEKLTLEETIKRISKELF